MTNCWAGAAAVAERGLLCARVCARVYQPQGRQGCRLQAGIRLPELWLRVLLHSARWAQGDSLQISEQETCPNHLWRFPAIQMYIRTT